MITQLCKAISSQVRHASTIGKNLLSGNISPTCPYNMGNFGPLSAENVSLVWGTPANFNWFRVLAALLYGTLLVDISQTAALNRGRHLYSAGRPSRWALAHVSSFIVCFIFYNFHVNMGYFNTTIHEPFILFTTKVEKKFLNKLYLQSASMFNCRNFTYFHTFSLTFLVLISFHS